MKKSLLIVLFIFFSVGLKSQQTIKYPDAEELEKYIKERTDLLLHSLYDRCLSGKIPAYLRDSCVHAIPIMDIKLRGSFLSEDKDAIVPFNKKDISGLWFLRTIKSNLDQTTQVLEISAVAILFHPIYNGHALPNQPLLWMKLSDIKSSLNADDFKFLVLLGNYAALNNQIKINDYDWSPNEQISISKNQYIAVDSMLMNKQARMILSGGSYFSIWQYEGRDLKTKSPMKLYDYQLKKYLYLYEIGPIYSDTILVLYNNLDSMIAYPCYPTYCDSLITDKNNKVLGLQCSLPNNDVHNDPKLAKPKTFRIDREVYSKFEGGRITLWYLEDYLRWHRLNPE